MEAWVAFGTGDFQPQQSSERCSGLVSVVENKTRLGLMEPRVTLGRVTDSKTTVVPAPCPILRCLMSSRKERFSLNLKLEGRTCMANGTHVGANTRCETPTLRFQTNERCRPALRCGNYPDDHASPGALDSPARPVKRCGAAKFL
jgi:hypothetical protein